MKHLAIRLPEESVRRADSQKLRAYVARNDQVPRTADEVSRSDVLRAAMVLGLEIMTRRADADLAASTGTGALPPTYAR